MKIQLIKLFWISFLKLININISNVQASALHCMGLLCQVRNGIILVFTTFSFVFSEVMKLSVCYNEW